MASERLVRIEGKYIADGDLAVYKEVGELIEEVRRSQMAEAWLLAENAILRNVPRTKFENENDLLRSLLEAAHNRLLAEVHILADALSLTATQGTPQAASSGEPSSPS